MLDWLLSIDFPGVEALGAQVETVRVWGVCDPSCGCPTVDLLTDPAAPSAQGLRYYPVVEGHIASDDPEEYFEVTLFARDGRRSMLELVCFTDDPPDEFPPPEDIIGPVVYSSDERRLRRESAPHRARERRKRSRRRRRA